MKIAFVGGSGVGKSTLMTELNKLIGLEIEQVSTQSIMNKYGLNNQSESIILGNTLPGIGIKFQEDLLKTRFEYFRSLKDKSFVTDRTPIDSFCYYLVQNSYWDTNENTERFFSSYCLPCYYLYDIVFGLHSGLFPIEDNGLRGVNKYFQSLVGDTILDYSKRVFCDKYVEIPKKVLSVQDRINFVLETINSTDVKS